MCQWCVCVRMCVSAWHSMQVHGIESVHACECVCVCACVCEAVHWSHMELRVGPAGCICVADVDAARVALHIHPALLQGPNCLGRANGKHDGGHGRLVHVYLGWRVREAALMRVQMGSKWVRNEFGMGLFWIHNGFMMDSFWIHIGLALDSQWTRFGQSMDSFRIHISIAWACAFACVCACEFQC
jgi:hypothetical protein